MPSTGDVGSVKNVEIWTDKLRVGVLCDADYRGLAAPLNKDSHMYRHSGGGVNHKPVPLELFIRSSFVSGPYGVGRL